MNDVNSIYRFLEQNSAEFCSRQAQSRTGNLIVEYRWKIEGVCAQWREISGERATPWKSVRSRDDHHGDRVVHIHLDERQIAIALAIGQGDMDSGIQAALEHWHAGQETRGGANHSPRKPDHRLPKAHTAR